MYIRSNPPVEYQDAWASNVGVQLNNSRVVAGAGIRVSQGADGTKVSVAGELDQVGLNFAGEYNISSSYQPNDLIFVNPNHSYIDWTGATIPFSPATSSTGLPGIAPGLWICTNYIGPLGYDTSMLETYVAPAYAAANQAITSTVADTYRYYSGNVYWPVASNYPSASYVTQSTWTTITSQSYWTPLYAATAASQSYPNYNCSVQYETTNSLFCSTPVLALTLTAGGSGYVNPSISFSGSCTTAATATATVYNGAITALTLVNPGLDYAANPTVVITDPSGSGATATAVASAYVAKSPELQGCVAKRTLASGPVISISVTSGGSSYSAAPTVGFTGGGGGSGATATAYLSGTSVSSVLINAGGTGYTSVPTVTFTPTSGGSGAAATAAISTFTDIEAIYPTYATGSVVIATTPIGGTRVSGVTLQDVNASARSWHIQFPTCENNGSGPTPMYRLFDASSAYVPSL